VQVMFTVLFCMFSCINTCIYSIKSAVMLLYGNLPVLCWYVAVLYVYFFCNAARDVFHFTTDFEGEERSVNSGYNATTAAVTEP